MPDTEKGPSFRFPSFPRCAPSGWKRGNGKQLIKEQGTLPYRERPLCFWGFRPGAPDGGLHAFLYDGGLFQAAAFRLWGRQLGETNRGARASRRPYPWGIRCRTRWQDAAPGVTKSRGQSLRSPLEVLSLKKAREDGASSCWSGRREAVLVTPEGKYRQPKGKAPQGPLPQASKTRLSNQKSRACGSRQLPAGRPALRQRCSRYCPRSQPCSTGTCGRKTPWRMPRRSSRP